MATLTTSYQLLAQTYLGNSYGDLYVRIYAKYLEQSIANNQTKVQYQARAYFSGNYIRDNQGSGGVSGTSASYASGACTYPTNGETVIATTEGWVSHNADGTMSISAAASLNFPNWGWSGTATGSASLPNIPRQATITGAPNFTNLDNPKITYSNPAGNAVSSLQACIANTAGNVIYVPYRNISTSGSSYTFNLTTAEREALLKAVTSASSFSVKFYVRTEISGTTFYSTLTKTFTVSSDIVPTASVVLSDAEGHLDTYGKYIQGKSKLQVSITAAGVYGSTIKSYKTTFDGKTYTSAEHTSDLIVGKDTLDVNIVVTDSRGRTCTISKSIEVYEYSPPKVLAISAKRCQQNNVNLIGDKYLGVLFDVSTTPLDSKNTVTYELDYKKTTEDSYTTVSLSDYTNLYEVEGHTVFEADNDAYNIVLRITDAFGSVEKKINGPSISVLISKLKYNLGLALGKMAELSGVFDIGFKTRFHGGILHVVLEDGANADEILTPNRYIVKAGRTKEGFPEAEVNAVLDVVGDDEIVKQTFSVTSKTNPRAYERVYTSEDNTWSSWDLINAPYGFIAGHILDAVKVEGYNIIPFVEKEKCGSYFELQNGIITIGKNVTYVRVSASIGGSAASGRCWAHLKHTDASQTAIARSDAIQYGTYVSPYLSDIIRVSEGDKLSVYTIEEFTPKSGGVDCYIYVERMK